jgi:tight adherence protein C
VSLSIGLLAGLGLFLFVSGLPIGANTGLARRVDPFVLGTRTRATSQSPGSKVGWVGSLLFLFPAPDDDLERRLAASRTGLSAGDFRVEQLLWTAIGSAVALALLTMAAASGLPVRPAPGSMLVLIFGALGGFGRDWYLSRQVELSRKALVSELPTAIDLMTIAVMSGESVAGALSRVAAILSPGIGEEFAEAMGDVRSGTPLVEALEDMALRVGDSNLSRFVDALSTAIDRGAPLGEVLRAQAGDLREAKRRRILEIGGRREVWMLVPVVFLIMPVVVIFALLPGLASLDLLVP